MNVESNLNAKGFDIDNVSLEDVETVAERYRLAAELAVRRFV
jgi:hypothetical protein